MLAKRLSEIQKVSLKDMNEFEEVKQREEQIKRAAQEKLRKDKLKRIKNHRIGKKGGMSESIKRDAEEKIDRLMPQQQKDQINEAIKSAQQVDTIIVDEKMDMENLRFAMQNLKNCKRLEIYNRRVMEKFGKNSDMKGIGYWGAFRCVQEIVLGDGIMQIPDGAFKEYTELKRVAGRNVVNIGNEAFYNCKNLEKVCLPNARNFGQNVFAGCAKIDCLSFCGGLIRYSREAGDFDVHREEGVTLLDMSSFSDKDQFTLIENMMTDENKKQENEKAFSEHEQQSLREQTTWQGIGTNAHKNPIRQFMNSPELPLIKPRRTNLTRFDIK